MVLGRRAAGDRSARESLRISPRLGLLYPKRAGQHGRHNGACPQRGDVVQVRIGHGHGYLDLAIAPRKTFRRRPAVRPPVVHAGVRSDRGGGQKRRQDAAGGQNAVHQGLASRRVGIHRVQMPRGKKGPPPHRARLRSARGLRFGALPERKSFPARERRIHAGGGRRQALDNALGNRSRQGRPNVSGPGNVPKNGLVGVELRRSGRAVRHHHQSLAHLPELRPHQRLESLLGVHVRGRFGLQPGQHKPDEVPARGRGLRRRAVQGRLPRRVYRPGNPGGSCQLSHEKDRA